MSHPHGDSQEPAYTADSASVPSQPLAPAAETFAPAFSSPEPPGFTPAQTPAAAPAAAPAAPAFSFPESASASSGAAAEATAAAPIAPTAAYPVAAPVSAPEFAPGSAPVIAPVSAPGYAPVSAAPYGYSATGYPLAAEPPKKRKTGTILFSIATVLLFLAAGGMTALYFIEHGNRIKAEATVADTKTLLSAEETKAKDLESKLSSARSDLTKANQDLTGAKAKTDEVTKERDALAECFRAIDTYTAAKNSANATQVIVKCTEAEKYY